VAGTAGASLTGHQVIAASAFVVTVLTVIGELWIGKRRDDVFSEIAMNPDADPLVLRELTIHEAVRAGLLSSEDTVRLLRAAPEDMSSWTASGRPYRAGPLMARIMLRLSPPGWYGRPRTGRGAGA
jgi:hypothetical protein